MKLEDRVEQISALVNDLRQAAGDGRKSRTLIDSLFRTVHSFKAAASAEGRRDVSNAAHQFENLLQALRTGEIALGNDVLQACEQSAAGLLDGSENSPSDSFTLIEVDKVKSQSLLPDEFSFLRGEEQHRAAAAMQEGANLYVLRVEFEVSDFDERFRQVEQRLEEVAELIATAASTQDNKMIFLILYAAKSEKISVQPLLRQAAVVGTAFAVTTAKQVEFIVRGEECLLDHQWADVLQDALLQLVRNAVDHGIEIEGTVVLEALTTPHATSITLTDDGRGIPPENLPLVFQAGFTTATRLTQFSGRGVGLDVVKTIVEELGGSVTVTSEPGKGTSFQITTPNPSSDA